jgi:ATP-dependent DNA helicase RecG
MKSFAEKVIAFNKSLDFKGALPDGITVADLKVEHNSILRNPDIAQMCIYRKHIEMLGTGTQRMIRDCKEHKFKVPVWKQGENITTVTFPDVSHNRKDKSITGAVIGGLTHVVKAVRNIDTGITINEFIANIDKSHRTIQRYIQLLRTLDLIEFKGAAKTGKYYLTAKTEHKLKQ